MESPYAEISLIGIKTEDFMILFDFLAISNEKKGNKFMELLEQCLINNKVKKIFHGHRLTSKVLANQYEIAMQNVFDIDVSINVYF